MRNIDKQLIDITIDMIAKYYNLSDDLRDILKNNIIKRSNMYDDNDIPNSNETRIIRNIDSISLFFLNRLLNNIRTYTIDIEETKDTNKGNYTSYRQEIDLRSKASIKKMIGRTLKDKIRTVDESVINKATNKVFDHEVGHALQTSFTGCIGLNDINFKGLIDSLNHEYPKYFYSYQDLGSEPLHKEKNGMKIVKKDDKYKMIRDYYAPNAYLTHIDEIFNEDEALIVSGITSPQFIYSFGGVYQKPIYNYDSSYYRVTSYAKMMKILIGRSNTFKAMYDDSVILYKLIDDFIDESDYVFGDNNGIRLTPMMNVLSRLDVVKASRISKNVIPQAYELDLFFTKCLETKVNKTLSNANLSDELIDNIIAQVIQFKDCLLTSPKTEVNTHIICDELVKKLLSKKHNNTFNVNSYLAIADKICEAIDLEDNQLYQSLLSQLQNINVNLTIPNSSDFNTMNNEEKRTFLIYNMQQALYSKDADSYRYYRANYTRLISNSPLNEEITPKV